MSGEERGPSAERICVSRIVGHASLDRWRRRRGRGSDFHRNADVVRDAGDPDPGTVALLLPTGAGPPRSDLAGSAGEDRAEPTGNGSLEASDRQNHGEPAVSKV